MLGLGACAATPDPAPPPAAAKSAPAKVAKKPVKKPAAKPANEPPAAAPAPVPAVEVEPEVAAAPAPPPLTAEPLGWPPQLPEPAIVAAPPPPPQQVAALPPQPLNVVGKSDAEVVALLGRPAGERTASAVKVMRFDAEGCAAEVHFFADVKQGGYRALEVTGAGSVPPPQCLGRVRANRG